VSLITNLVPINLFEQKEKFFAVNGDYNPQFIYPRVYSPAVLIRYGIPDERQAQAAHDYLQTHPLGDSPVVTDPLEFGQLQEILAALCRQLGIKPIELVQNPRQNSRFMMTGAQTLSVQWPAKISREQVTSVLNHEVQTHLLRRLNDERQPWHEQTRSRRRLWKKTEEGLAIYNSKDKNDPDLRQAALLYWLVALARKHDFRTVYQASLSCGVTRGRAFTNALRVKRGLTDTSQPGGFTKDLVYWEGYHQVAAYLRAPGHSICDLYWGKVGCEEIEQLRAQAVTEGLIYPTFVSECR